MITARESQKFILSIAKGNKEIGPTIAAHFIVGLFTILQL